MDFMLVQSSIRVCDNNDALLLSEMQMWSGLKPISAKNIASTHKTSPLNWTLCLKPEKYVKPMLPFEVYAHEQFDSDMNMRNNGFFLLKSETTNTE